jgi:hypothetical protein
MPRPRTVRFAVGLLLTWLLICLCAADTCTAECVGTHTSDTIVPFNKGRGMQEIAKAGAAASSAQVASTGTAHNGVPQVRSSHSCTHLLCSSLVVFRFHADYLQHQRHRLQAVTTRHDVPSTINVNAGGTASQVCCSSTIKTMLHIPLLLLAVILLMQTTCSINVIAYRQ